MARATSRKGGPSPNSGKKAAKDHDDDSFESPASEAAEESSAFEESGYSDASSEYEAPQAKKGKRKPKSGASSSKLASSSHSEKKPKLVVTARAPPMPAKQIIARIFSPDVPTTNDPSLPPTRLHSFQYHQPLLLESSQGGIGVKTRQALLDWFESVKEDRSMPWRQEWIDPNSPGPDGSDVSDAIKLHGYRVWISEIMLQQTRVATVIEYFNRWMDKWPAMENLAAAKPEEVLASWKGLGYYSRSARIHEAAQKVVSHKKMKGLLPELPEELSKEVPGVGPYTAGAISSIVYGHAVPIIDGNVIRVLSRQMGLLANTKEKAYTDLLWEAARRIVRRVALDFLNEKDSENDLVEGTKILPRSKIPGAWNQSLMELGSTICAPKPACHQCPIQSTCRAFHEGKLLASSSKESAADVDMEDLCSVCEPVPAVEEDLESTKKLQKLKKAPGLKQSTLSFGAKPIASKTETQRNTSGPISAIIENHVRLFPLKAEKAKQRVEECAVCLIEDAQADGTKDSKRAPSHYLLEQRPNKGLLASMWQFPMLNLSANDASEPKKRARLALDFSRTLAGRHPRLGKAAAITVVAGQHLGTIQHVFSHLIWNMHIYTFRVTDAEQAAPSTVENAKSSSDLSREWFTATQVTSANMGTGHVNIWKRFRSSP